MPLRIVDALDDIPAADWDRLAGDANPFLSHAFLAALEHHDCVGERFGWYPRHLTLYDAERLIGAVPLYLKDNSYGELVFDFAWADAYRRAGLRYYPKAVAAIPYTPATGPRLLLDPTADTERAADLLTGAAVELCRELELSSLHWLFTDAADTARLQARGFLLRRGVQFHWHNPGYRDFDDFLSGFTAAKRKKLKRERRRVSDAGIELRVVHGHEADAALWRTVHGFYTSTFDRKSGIATLSLDFFREIGRTLGDRIVLVIAYVGDRPVACAINLRGRQALYGRHWGCLADYHSLHFEACYYQGIDYCIRHGLTLFEPGAQGEHKISRGFVPVSTWSAHWIADDRFRASIADFLQREDRAMRDYIDELREHLPYRADAPAPRAGQPGGHR
ncbi:MAG: GNAT family N-acetyltransferase [Thiohalobacteraceae bacterium]|nr:GNAT family N-acetyltransferase [Gammaproteobacteria bacterium]